jgi:hypothetical protein
MCGYLRISEAKRKRNATASEIPTIRGGRRRDVRTLSLWMDADPDIPILKQAKAEYAKLQ